MHYVAANGTGYQRLDWDPVVLSKLPFISMLLGLLFPELCWTFPTARRCSHWVVPICFRKSYSPTITESTLEWTQLVIACEGCGGQWHLASLNLKPGSLINLTAPRPPSWMLNLNHSEPTTCHGMWHIPLPQEKYVCQLSAAHIMHKAKGKAWITSMKAALVHAFCKGHKGKRSKWPAKHRPIELKQSPRGPCCQCH